MLLENENIKLRALEPEDLEILYKWENDTNLWIHGNTISPYSKLALRQYITESQQQDIYQTKQLRLMIQLKESPSVIGTIDLYDFDFQNQRAGIGILIDANYRQKNYGTQVLDLIKDYTFNFLKINQLYAYIAVDNNKSIRLFEKSGYVRTSALKSWIRNGLNYKDVYIYQLIN